MQTIDTIHTPCKNCVFAEYNDKTQIGCHLKYIDRFKRSNIDVIEAYDEEKEFYIINKKKCIGYRENKWFASKNLGDASLDDKIEFFNKHNFLHYLLIINLSEFNTEESINSLISELNSLVIKPRKVIFVRYVSNKNHPYSLVQDILRKSQLDCKWRLQTMLDDQSYIQVLHESLNLNKKYRFVLSINTQSSNINKLVDKANQTVYHDMGVFVLLKDEKQSSMLFSTSNYRHMLLIEHKDLFTYTEAHTVI